MPIQKRYSLALPNRRVQHQARRLSSIVYRVVILGNKNVGKTSLIKRYVTGEYNENYIPTVSDMYEKTVTRANDIAFYTLRMYDTAGGMKYEFPVMYRMTVNQGDIFILIYSVDNRESFLEVSNIWKDIKELKGKESEDLPAVIVANKSDINKSDRKVSEEEGKQFADEIDCAFIEVSASLNLNVEAIYQDLLTELEMLQIDTLSRLSLSRRLNRRISALHLHTLDVNPSGDNFHHSSSVHEINERKASKLSAEKTDEVTNKTSTISKIRKRQKLLKKRHCIVM